MTQTLQEIDAAAPSERHYDDPEDDDVELGQDKCWELPADEFKPYLRATSQGLSYHLAMAIKAIEETWILK